MTTGLVALGVVLSATALSGAAGEDPRNGRATHRDPGGPAPGYLPPAARPSESGRYFVRLRGAPVAARVARAEAAGRALTAAEQRAATDAVRASQAAARSAVRAAGGAIVFGYARVVNGFSAVLSPAAAATLAGRADVASVEPVTIVRKSLESSVPFIGAPHVWRQFGATGAGVRVAVIDTGVDYTHRAFGGPGTVRAYERNDPTLIEPGTFPTRRVVDGFDFVGEDYDVLDEDADNDVPRPDPDPLDFDGHGTHTASTCCGAGVPGSVGRGVAPDARILAYRVWDVGNSTADVLVAAYERAMDPNEDGSVRDRVDVISFSGGVTYGTAGSTEALAAQRVVDLGTVFVASAGNEGNQAAGGSPYVLGTPASASGVIAVAASIDQFVAQTAEVTSPEGVDLPEGGIIVHQDWSAPVADDVAGELFDARAVDPPADPDGQPVPADRQLCDTTPAGQPFAGRIVLVFKGPFGEGDCVADEKAIHAEEAGAIGVLFWDGFGGLPSQYAPDFPDGTVGIPAWSISDDDGAALAAALSPDAPASYNTQAVSVVLHAQGAVIPGFADRLTDFSSEGPSRGLNELKPDVAAPGSDITAAGAGTGTGSLTISGTSMAAPHVSGVAALLLQMHPSWTPAQVKAAIMNQAVTEGLTDVNGEGPVPASLIGAGRVDALEAARATSLAVPGSLSFGLRAVSGERHVTRRFMIHNVDSRSHRYALSSAVRYTDFAGAVAEVQLSTDGSSFGEAAAFTLGPGARRAVWARLTLDPTPITPVEQLFGWYYFNAAVDGQVEIVQTGGRTDRLHVPWHVVPLAAADTSTPDETVDLSSGSDTIAITGTGAGVRYADAYLLGAEDEVDSFGEEDITHVGARSFAGSSIDGEAEGVPTGVDPLGELSWVDFLTSADAPTEPVEFGVRTRGLHNTTETLEVEVRIDAGADGVFADEELAADYLAVKLPGGGETCLYDLAAADPFAECAATYFTDYSNFNTNVLGIAVDAADIGLTDAGSELSYMVTACTGGFAGDVPSSFCDTAGGIDEETGTYTSRLDVVDPALDIEPLVCGGFWGDPACSSITVSAGSAAAGDAPAVLLLFPNNEPFTTARVVSVTGLAQ